MRLPWLGQEPPHWRHSCLGVGPGCGWDSFILSLGPFLWKASPASSQLAAGFHGRTSWGYGVSQDLHMELSQHPSHQAVLAKAIQPARASSGQSSTPSHAGGAGVGRKSWWPSLGPPATVRSFLSLQFYYSLTSASQCPVLGVFNILFK